MSVSNRYLFLVSMDVAPEAEALFNEVYDDEHVPYLMAVPGVHAVRRAVAEPFVMAIAGGLDERAAASPRYLAIYEIAEPEVVKSEAWAEAVEKGRWARDVRPYTTNRRHAMYRLR